MANRALTPLPSTLKPRRRRVRATRHRARRRQPSVPDESLVEDIPCDTLVAVQTLHRDWPQEARHKLPRTPPVLLLTQLDSLLVDRANTRRELATLVETCLRPVRLPSAAFAYVMHDDYCAGVDPRFAALCDDVRETWIHREQVEEAVGEDGASQLVRLGFLTMRDEQSFWFAIPSMGAFLREREKGNNQILSLLRRAQYKEMLVDKLEARTLRDTCFTARWHVRDVVGAGGVEVIDTTIGVLIRLKR